MWRHMLLINQATLSKVYIDGLVQDCSNSSALAMELLQFCIKPSTLFSFY